MIMSIEEEMETKPRLWVGLAFMGLGSVLLCVGPTNSSMWEESLLILLGVTIFSYHIAKYLVPF